MRNRRARNILVGFGILCLSVELRAQNSITTIAGQDWVFPPTPVQATAAPLGQISGISVGRQGDLYIADTQNHLVFKVDSRGAVTVLAGNGIAGFSGDGGAAQAASLNGPTDVAVDSAGTVYIADAGNNRVRSVANGIISTFAGTGKTGYNGDDIPATQATLYTPTGVFVDSGNLLYIADSNNNRIRVVDANQNIHTRAGNGVSDAAQDGIDALSAPLRFPRDVVLDSGGNLYIADSLNHAIRKVDTAGLIRVVAGSANGQAGSSADGGLAVNARLTLPQGLTIDAQGNLIIAETGNHRIRVVGKDGIISTLAGNSVPGFTADPGPVATATFSSPISLDFDAAGNLLIADRDNSRVRRIAGGQVSTLVGNGRFRITPEPINPRSAYLSAPSGIAFDSLGNLYVADRDDHKIRKVSPGVTSPFATSTTASLVTYAGIGAFDYFGDGKQALQAALKLPADVVADAGGNVYIADRSNRRVRIVSPSGVIDTYAGTGATLPQLDGVPSKSSALASPAGLALDPSGNLLIADAVAHRIRRIQIRTGLIETVAGTDVAGVAKDGGLASSEPLNAPEGVAVDKAGNIYVADTGNNRILKIAEGRITTFAGDGAAAFAGDGSSARQASLNGPTKIAVGPNGSLYIADTLNHCVRVVSTDGIINTIAGSGIAGFNGDGENARTVMLNSPSGVAVSSTGTVYIADTGNNRIRTVASQSGPLSVTPRTLAFQGSSLSPPGPVQFIKITVGDATSTFASAYSITADSQGGWLQVGAASGATPATVEISADPGKLAAGTYTATLRISSGPFATPLVVPVTFTVGSVAPPILNVDSLSTTIRIDAGAHQDPVPVLITNQGGGALNVRITSNADWVTVTPAAATVSSSSPLRLTISAKTETLPPGTHTAQIAIASGDPRTPDRSLAITVIVSPDCRMVSCLPSTSTATLSKSSLLFVTMEGAPKISLPQQFTISSSGRGDPQFSIVSQRLDGQPWLSVRTEPAGATLTRVLAFADTTTLKTGTYYGYIQITGHVANSPSFVPVALLVLPRSSDTLPLIDPVGLIFVSDGSSAPSSQNFSLYNGGTTDLAWNSRSFDAKNRNWLVQKPTSGVLAPGESVDVVIQVDPRGLSPDVYNGTVAMAFESPLGRFSTANVNIRFSVGRQATFSPAAPRNASTCTAQDLLPVISSIGYGGRVMALYPTPVEIRVVDSAGCAALAGDVSTIFRENVPDVSLASLADGRWEGIWTPDTARNYYATGKITIAASAFEPKSDERVVTVDDPPPGGPYLRAVNIVDTASLQGGAVAPGSLITVFGLGFASAAQWQAPAGAWPNRSPETSAKLAGLDLPLQFVAPGQINTIVPYDVQPGIDAQLLVFRGVSLTTVPLKLTITEAQPAIYNGQIVHSQTLKIVDRLDPAKAGEEVSISCSGLGRVTPAIAAGSPAPSDPPALIPDDVPRNVSIGGLPAVVTFAGLKPGEVGVYLVKAIVPDGVPTGASVPVTITVAGRSSAAATMAIQ